MNFRAKNGQKLERLDWNTNNEKSSSLRRSAIFVVFFSSSFCSFRNDKKLMILPPPVQKMTGRHSVFSSSKMQAKLKNALQLSFATCQHSPWFLMTFQMMHKPRIRNSNLQFCPISNFNLRCNFLQSLHFTVTLWTSFFKYTESYFYFFHRGKQIVSFFR